MQCAVVEVKKYVRLCFEGQKTTWASPVPYILAGCRVLPNLQADVRLGQGDRLQVHRKRYVRFFLALQIVGNSQKLRHLRPVIKCHKGGGCDQPSIVGDWRLALRPQFVRNEVRNVRDAELS